MQQQVNSMLYLSKENNNICAYPSVFTENEGLGNTSDASKMKEDCAVCDLATEILKLRTVGKGS